MQTTYVAKKGEVTSDWYVVDAADQVLGRLCTRIANRLSGKSKPQYTPFIDTGDHIVVINAAKVKLTGRKLDQKEYVRHTGYPGGLKTTGARKMYQLHPEQMIIAGVRGMLPKSRLGRAMLKKLKVYAGAEHPHEAQTPQPLAVMDARK